MRKCGVSLRRRRYGPPSLAVAVPGQLVTTGTTRSSSHNETHSFAAGTDAGSALVLIMRVHIVGWTGSSRISGLDAGKQPAQIKGKCQLTRRRFHPPCAMRRYYG